MEVITRLGDDILIDGYRFDYRETQRLAAAYGLPCKPGTQFLDSPREPDEIWWVDHLPPKVQECLMADLRASLAEQRIAELKRPAPIMALFRWIKARF